MAIDIFTEAGSEDPKDLIKRVATEEQVDPAILLAMADQESSFNPQAEGPPTKWGTAKGMFQILDSNAQQAGIDPTDPEAAARWAANYVKEALAKGHITDADIAKYYHGGPDTKIWGPKTEEHGRVVARKTAEYRSEGADIFTMAGAAPEPQDTGPDMFTTAGASEFGSNLAKHRWDRLRNLNDGNRMPTPQGDIPYEQLVNEPIEPDSEEVARQQKGLLSGVNVAPSGVMETGVTKEQEPNALKRAYYNVPKSTLGLAMAPASMAIGAVPDMEAIQNIVTKLTMPVSKEGLGKDFAKAAEAPLGVAKELVHYIGNIAKTSGKAGVWLAAKGVNPNLTTALENAGINPHEFVDTFADDPIGTSLVMLEGPRLVGLAKKGAHYVTDLPGIEPLTPGDFRAEIPKRVDLEGMTPEQYEKITDALAKDKGIDEMRVAQQTAQRGPASESAQAFTGKPRVEMPPQTLTHFEAALDSLRGQLEEGGAKGKLEPKTPGKKGGGIHPLTALLAEAQLVHPELSMKELKRRLAADKEAFLRDVAMARAKDAVATHATEFADIPGKMEAATAPGVGSEQGVPINRPLGEFPNARLNDMRRASKTVDDFHQGRQSQPRKPGGTIVGSGAGNLQVLYEKLIERIKSRRVAGTTNEGRLTETGELDQFTPEQIKQLGDALNDEMTNPRDLKPSPEDLAKLRNNPAVPGADYVPVPTPEKASLEYQPMMERRDFGTQREYIHQTVRDWHDKLMAFNDAHDAVELLKEQGKITGAQESAFYREIQKRYKDPELATTTPEETFVAPEEGANTLEAQLSEQRQARPPISREPGKGITLGSGLGALQGQLEKTWSNGARLIEELPERIKADGLLNALTKGGQKMGVPLTKNEVQALELHKFIEQNRGRQIERKDLREWVADRVVRTEERELGEGLFDKEAYERKLAQYSATTEPTLRSKLKDELGRMEVARDEAKPKFATTDNITLEGGTNYREIIVKAPTTGEPAFKGGHFDPNTIAHMRTTDREVRVGGSYRKTLFSEEFQSDWNKAVRKTPEQVGHPLLSEWKETLFKRLIRKAAEEGKDAVGWTTGKQQSERYNLRKHVEKVSLELLQNGKYRLTGVDKNGSNVVARQLSLAELPDVVGKDVAAKLLEGASGKDLETSGRTAISGKELDFGGNWAIDLYDRQMVDIANKYAKRYGEKVEPGTIDHGPIHTLKLTQEMKKSLLEEGNPTFGFLTKEGHAEAVRNLKNIWKNMGRTLGSGPGEPIYGLFENLTKIGLYHIKNGVTDFTAWSEAIRNEADANGFSVTDAMLHDSWNAKASKDARMPLRPVQAAAASIPNMNVQTPASLLVGQANVNTGTRLLASDMKLGPTSFDAMTDGNNTLNLLHRIWESDFGSRSGIDAHARQWFPTLHEWAVKHVNAQGIAFLKATRHTNELKKIFDPTGKNKAASQRYLHDLADLVADDRAVGLQRKTLAEVGQLRKKMEAEHAEATENGRTEDAKEILSALQDLGPAGFDIKPMEPGRRARLLADPKIRAAVEYWHTRITPEIDLMSKNVGADRRLMGDLGLYVKFQQIDTVTAKRMQRTRPIGEYIPVEGEGPAGTTPGTTRMVSPHASRPGRSGSTKAATGKLQEGQFYENDLKHMLENTYRDRVLADTKNRFRAELEKVAIAKRSTNGTKPVPRKVQMGTVLGKKNWEAVIPITLEGTTPFNGDVFYVPETAARLFSEMQHVSQNNLVRSAWDKVSSINTGMMIASPAEAVRHAWSAMSAVVNTSFYAKHGTAAEIGEAAIAGATLGMSKIALAIKRAYNLEGPVLADAVERYGGGAGLRLSGYEGTSTPRSFAMRAVEKVPGMHTLKDLVFGDPGTTKGLKGMETRLRIVVGEVIREMRPQLSDVEVSAKLNDAYGSYVEKVQPALTKFFLPFDPFARAGVGLTRSGVRLLAGRDATGKYNPAIHAQVAGTIAALMGYNMLMDDEHKLPTEHPEYRFGDLVMFRRNGKIYRLGFSDISNSLKRGLEFTGINSGVNAWTRGERDPQIIAKEMVRGSRNSIVNRASPLIKLLTRITTGKSLAISPSGDAYSVVKSSMSSSKRGKNPIHNLVDMIAHDAFPFVGKVGTLGAEVISPLTKEGSALRPEYDKTMPESWAGRVVMDVADTISLPGTPMINTEEKLASKKSDVQNRIQQEYTATVRSIAREALNFPEEQRVAYVMHQIDLRISEEIVTELGNPMPAQPAAFKSILSMLYRSSAYNTKKEMLQDINNSPIDVPKEPAPQAPQPPAAPQPPSPFE